MSSRRIPPGLHVGGLTNTVFIVGGNGTKTPVPENQMVAALAAFLDDHDVTVGEPGARRRYVRVCLDHEGEAGKSCTRCDIEGR